MHSTLLILLAAVAAPVEIPRMVDPRLKIELVAAEPDVVTPTGIAVDERGRVLCIESHTHFRPNNYVGPKADRIQMYEDSDGDAKADRITTFYEGTTYTMNLAIFRDGSVYVATRNEVFRLRDTNDDGVADERTPIIRMDTAGNYPHNGLSGFAFDFADNIYFGMGENLGVEYKLIGNDGTTLSGREGGHVFRCDRNGNHLVRWATGFWNPFHLTLDAYERLFVVDNDPDSLPPCRLLHVVQGGDYGYKFRNGRKGLHPFTAWNGELPGTLPMVAGTGEAPSGILAYESDNLPEDYRGDLLGTSWGDHRIERFKLEPQGASFRSQMQPVVVGGDNFRPVGIALAPDGSLFISDWMDKSYPIHGKGRIWKLSAKDTMPAKRPAEPSEAVLSKHRPLRERGARELASPRGAGVDQLKKLAQTQADPAIRATVIVALQANGNAPVELPEQSLPALRALAIQTWTGKSDLPADTVKSDQPEVHAAAVRASSFTSAAADKTQVLRDLESEDPFVWQAARLHVRNAANLPVANVSARALMSKLLNNQEAGTAPDRETIRQALAHPDPWVRFVAIRWIGEELLSGFDNDLPKVLAAGPLTERLFSAYLAALERLNGGKRNPKDEWNPEQYLATTLTDGKTPPEALRWALRMLRPDHPSLSESRLKQFLADGDAALRAETVRTIRDGKLPTKAQLLLPLASSERGPLRLEAISGLQPSDAESRKLLFAYLASPQPDERAEALRSLRGATLSDNERSQLATVAQSHPEQAELVQRVVDPIVMPTDRPQADDLASWLKLLEGSADPEAGQRIFYHAKSAGCARCHQMAGRGGKIGPDLTTTPRTLTRERLVDSILRPSKEIAPMFVSWTIETESGRALSGMLVSQAVNGELTYANDKGELFRLKPAEIESRRPSAKSIMPDGLSNSLTLQEFRDLLAFLLASPDQAAAPKATSAGE